MRVVLLKGSSTYGVLLRFVDDVAQAFERRGIDARIVKVEGHMTIDQVAHLSAAGGPVDLLYSFNVLGETRNGENKTLGMILGVPHVVHYVDYPLTHGARLSKSPPEARLLVIDRSHVDAVEAAYGRGHFAHVGFCAHAGIGEPSAPEATPAAFEAARPIPILFTGTFYRPEQRPWARLGARFAPVFDAAIEIARAEEFLPAHIAVEQAMTAHNFDLRGPEHGGFMRNAFFVHEAVRAERRFAMLKAAAKVGLPMHVYGKGYEKQLYRFKNVTFGGEADIAKVLELMRLSRVVLNVNANFGAGSHERPLTAMVSGAAAATDASGFYTDHFTEGEEIAHYRWSSLDADLAAIGAIAREPRLAHNIAVAGHARAVAEHRWDARIDTILAAAGVGEEASRHAA